MAIVTGIARAAAIPPRGKAGKAGKAAKGSKRAKKGTGVRIDASEAKMKVDFQDHLIASTGRGGGGKKPPRMPVSTGPVPANGPVSPRARTSVDFPRQPRQERFMGNAEIVRDSRPALGGPSKKSKPNYAAGAGGIAVAGAALYAGGERRENQAPKATQKPASGPSSRRSGPLPGLGGAGYTSPAPKTAPRASQRPSVASAGGTSAPKSAPKPSRSSSGGSKGRKMSGQELADYLGLSGDSAVRTYMTTGKHKYEPKYPGKAPKRTLGTGR